MIDTHFDFDLLWSHQSMEAWDNYEKEVWSNL
jgi:hypothetical protein